MVRMGGERKKQDDRDYSMKVGEEGWGTSSYLTTSVQGEAGFSKAASSPYGGSTVGWCLCRHLVLLAMEGRGGEIGYLWVLQEAKHFSTQTKMGDREWTQFSLRSPVLSFTHECQWQGPRTLVTVRADSSEESIQPNSFLCCSTPSKWSSSNTSCSSLSRLDWDKSLCNQHWRGRPAEAGFSPGQLKTSFQKAKPEKGAGLHVCVSPWVHACRGQKSTPWAGSHPPFQSLRQTLIFTWTLQLG